MRVLEALNVCLQIKLRPPHQESPHACVHASLRQAFLQLRVARPLAAIRFACLTELTMHLR
jgi:hypothetical protein